MDSVRPAALIAYDGLPISSGGGHTLRLRDRHAIWSRMSRFLATFATGGEPDGVRLLLSEGAHVDRSFFERVRDVTSAEFGASTRRASVAGALNEHEHAWTLRPRQIEDALAVMDRAPAIPEHLGRGLFALGIESVFLLRDPETGETLPMQSADLHGNQEAGWKLLLGQSRVYLRLSRRSTCALFLSLPFPELTPEALRFIGQVQDALPFGLSPANWARWQLNAAGTRYYKRRLGSPDAP